MATIMTARSNDRAPMPTSDTGAQDAPNDAALVAMLLSVDGTGLGGVVLDHPLHDSAKQFVTAMQRLLPDGAPMRRVPIGVSADRLIGGVDLAATLALGRLVSERGVLAMADGGIVVLPMTERATVSVRTTLSEVLDRGALMLARDGVEERHNARVIAVLLDESVDDEAIHPALVDRTAFRLALDPDDTAHLEAALDVNGGASIRDIERFRERACEARGRLSLVTLDDTWLTALCNTAELFGVASVRAVLFAIRCARAHAALAGRLLVGAMDAEVAARLVLAPRATRIPAPLQEEQPTPPPDGPPTDPGEPPPPASNNEPVTPEPNDAADDTPDDAQQPTPTLDHGELLRHAVHAGLPPGLLAQLLEHLNVGTMSGRVGAEQQNMLRGRPRGARSGLPRGGARLHLLETLRAAAPWQRMRARAALAIDASRALHPIIPPALNVMSMGGVTPTRPRVSVRREDFRIRRFVERTGTTVHFVVDASGSSAINRLGEAKGAVELLLAESYARRDRVSLLAFRGTTTEVLLPPTRALARARRVLAALPGGGGTPMATAIDAAVQQALATRRSGSAPLVVILSDGRANIARDGTPGRPGAERDALLASRAFAMLNIPAMFVDTSPRGEAVARRIAEAMRARYVFLPSADAKALGGLVRTAMQIANNGTVSG